MLRYAPSWICIARAVALARAAGEAPACIARWQCAAARLEGRMLAQSHDMLVGLNFADVHKL